MSEEGGPRAPREAPDTEPLLDALDRVREVRGSLALFDALVAGEPARVRDAVAAYPRHPLRADVLAWLAARGVAPPPEEGPAAALARHGIDDLDAFVATAQAREAALTRALADARAERELALRSANAYALVAALLAAVAIGGWFVALGGFPLPEEPPVSPARSPGTSGPSVPTEDP